LDEVKHIADLARLDLTADEMERYRQQLSAVLDYFKDLQTVDTRTIVPNFSVVPQEDAQKPSHLRADEVHSSLTREALLANAPDADADQFRVPPVLDYEE